MTIDERIKDEKVQYDSSKKMSALPSGKTDNNEYLTGEEILPPAQNRSIKEVRFTYSSLVKAFEDQGEKQKKLL